MRVSIEIPGIEGYPPSFLAFWSRGVPIPFGPKPVTQNYQVHALAGNYVRLVEHACAEYRAGAEDLKLFWDTHDSFNISAFNRSISHFETCVLSTHRAINMYRRLRRNRDSDPLAVYLNTQKPAFAGDSVADKLRAIRHEITHLDERLVEGGIQQGQPFALKPDGPETQALDDPNLTVKHFDRVIIGALELSFIDLVAWLSEMCSEAQRIARF